MKFFIDTANLDEINEANELGLITLFILLSHHIPQAQPKKEY